MSAIDAIDVGTNDKVDGDDDEDDIYDDVFVMNSNSHPSKELPELPMQTVSDMPNSVPLQAPSPIPSTSITVRSPSCSSDMGRLPTKTQSAEQSDQIELYLT